MNSYRQYFRLLRQTQSLKEICEGLGFIANEFLAEARERGFDPKTQPMLKHFSAVGARYAEDNDSPMQNVLKKPDTLRTELTKNDNIFLIKAFRNFLHAGFIIDPDFEIDIVNLQYGRDFLTETGKTDVILGCYLFHGERDWNPDAREWEQDLLTLRGDNKDRNLAYSFNRFVRSPHANETGVWHARAKQAEAKIIANYNGGLDGWQFTGEGYRLWLRQGVQLDQEYEYIMGDEYWSKMQAFLNENSSLVMGFKVYEAACGPAPKLTCAGP